MSSLPLYYAHVSVLVGSIVRPLSGPVAFWNESYNFWMRYSRVVAISTEGFTGILQSSYSNSLVIEMKLFSSLFVIASMMVVGGFAAATAGGTLSGGITVCTNVTNVCTGVANSMTGSSSPSEIAVCLLCHLRKSYIDD